MRRFSLVLFSLILIELHGCRADQENLSSVKTVFGSDDRISSTGRALGRILPVQGSGTLVSSRLVLTAAHCVYLNGLRNTQTFFRQDGSEESIPATIAAIGTQAMTTANFASLTSVDWAILLLERPVMTRPFRIASTRYLNPLNRLIWQVGYSSDRPNLSMASNCSVRAIIGGVLFHDCDLKPGASGGPLFAQHESGEFLITGVQSGEVRGHDGEHWRVEISNTASSADNFIDVANELLLQHP